MASDFVGETVLVTLSVPPGAQVHGVVADIVDHTLRLIDVTLLWSGQRIPTYTIKSFLIADLELIQPNEPVPADGHLVTPTNAAQPFVDPAILSFAKPIRDGAHPHTSPRPVISPVMIANGMVASPASKRPAGQSSVSSVATAIPVQRGNIRSRKDSSATATLTEPFDALALSGENVVKNNAPKSTAKRLGRKSKQAASQILPGSDNGAIKGVAEPKEISTQQAPGIGDVSDITNGLHTNIPLLNKKGAKGKGWRQTPLIEEMPQKRPRKARKIYAEDASGWATEDATDIQDLGEFDFASNLSKFDKRQVFDDIRKDDHTADDERLVSFNRVARPGTNGGKNLHYTENVLDPEPKEDGWQGETEETEDDRREDHYSSGRGSKRAGSGKPLQSRKGSAFPALQGLRTESPRPLTRMGTASPINGSMIAARALFKFANTNKPCTTISPLQMVELEQVCISEIGMTEDMLTENAGMRIAEAILKEPCKSVLFLVGNHKSGARAVAAARQLRNRRFRVTVCVLGGEREDLLLDTLRRQLSIYRKSHGYVDRWDEYQTKSTSQPLDTVVDALLGMHVALDELRTEEQAAAFEMIKWVNRAAESRRIVSIEVPSGLSATTGIVTEVDAQPLMIAGQLTVVCLAAPKNGLLALAETDVAAKVVVVDIGIGPTAWKQGSRRRHGIEFGAEWILPLTLST